MSKCLALTHRPYDFMLFRSLGIGSEFFLVLWFFLACQSDVACLCLCHITVFKSHSVSALLPGIKHDMLIYDRRSVAQSPDLVLGFFYDSKLTSTVSPRWAVYMSR